MASSSSYRRSDLNTSQNAILERMDKMWDSLLRCSSRSEGHHYASLHSSFTFAEAAEGRQNCTEGPGALLRPVKTFREERRLERQRDEGERERESGGPSGVTDVSFSHRRVRKDTSSHSDSDLLLWTHGSISSAALVRSARGA